MDPNKFNECDAHDSKLACGFTTLKLARKPEYLPAIFASIIISLISTIQEYLNLNLSDKLKLLRINVLHNDSGLE